MSTKYPEVKIIADSVYPGCPRITTFQLKYWRPLLAEINTHRVLSRNASSSRAQKFSDRCEQVIYDPVLPNHWNAEKAGMVGGDEFPEEVKEFINHEIRKMGSYVSHALLSLDKKVKEMTGFGIHKQYLNRYLEPFTATTQLVTATDWDNFFKLRLAPDAQPEIQDVAKKMAELLKINRPIETDLHIPFVTEAEQNQYDLPTLKKIAVARCARISYRPYDGNTLLEKDLALYERLKTHGHLSPFEHIATADSNGERYFNLNGWRSYRYDIEADYGTAGSSE